jgi:hypothetical protein
MRAFCPVLGLDLQRYLWAIKSSFEAIFERFMRSQYEGRVNAENGRNFVVHSRVALLAN